MNQMPTSKMVVTYLQWAGKLGKTKKRVINRRDGPEDINRPFEIEFNAMHMTQEMQMMKEKMDMMMNAMKG